MHFSFPCIIYSKYPYLRQGDTPLIFGFLPILNGLTDFLSFGATRWILRNSLKKSIIIGSLFDLLFSCAVFCFSVCTFITIVFLVNANEVDKIVDLSLLFNELQDHDLRNNYFWLAFMLFSVTVPTALNITLGLVLFMTVTTRSAGKSIGHWLDGTPTQIMVARYGLAALAGLATSFVSWAAWQALIGSPRLLNGFIDIFACYHDWLVS